LGAQLSSAIGAAVCSRARNSRPGLAIQEGDDGGGFEINGNGAPISRNPAGNMPGAKVAKTL